MHNRLSFIAIAMVMAMTTIFSSCSDKDEQEETGYTQQSILVFMPWSDNSLHQSLMANLESIKAGIKAQKGLKNTRLFVAAASNSSKAYLYEIIYKNGVCKNDTIQSYNSKDWTTAEGIATIINKVKERSNALNYAMIIGCHGTGWTGKNDWQDYPNMAKAYGMQYTQGKIGDYPLTRFLGAVGRGLEEYRIDISTLSEAIKQTNIKMQYILFDNCYMANVETAYEMKDVTNFMVASTSEIMAVGMPYKAMWSSLASATPDYSQMVNTYYNFFSSYSYPYGSIAAIDCRQMDDLAKIMKEINASYSFDASLRDSVQVLDGFNTAMFYDLGSYVDNLCQDEALKTKFTKQLDKVVKYKKSTEKLYSYLYYYQGPTYITVNEFSGLTTSAPSVNPVAERGWRNTKWAQDTTN